MDSSATNLGAPVKILVFGQPRPYIARPSTFVRKRPGRNGQKVGSIGVNMVKDPEDELYQDRIEAAAGRAMNGRPMFEGPVRLDVRAFVPLLKRTSKADREAIALGLKYPVARPDMTNIIKLAEDALNGVVFKDDNLVARGSDRTGRYYSRWPRIEIEVTPIVEACELQAAEMARVDIADLVRFDPVGAAEYV